ncbi:MAG: FAD-binding protein [Thermoplasmata archaeon]
MRIAILVKVVADRETAEPAPDGTIARSSNSAFINPYDQRAVRVGLDLRRPGETVTVVSMGAPSSVEALAPYRSAGIDRIVLLSDERLRGSDLIGTARALTETLRFVGSDLILAGERATDSETGALPAAVAARLEIPSVTRTRGIVRVGDSDDLEIETEFEDGSARYRLRAPALVSVGEKIAKPLKVARVPEEAAAAVERVDLEGVGVGANDVGRSGARSRVVTWAPIGRSRIPRLFDRTRLAYGLEAIQIARGASVALAATIPTVSGRSPDGGPGLLALVTDDVGGIDGAALSAISGLAQMLPTTPIDALWVGPPAEINAARRLAEVGVRTIYGATPPEESALSEVASRAFERASELAGPPQAVVLAQSTFGLEVAGRFAGRSGRGLVTNVESVEAMPGRPLRWTKASWGGRFLAVVETIEAPSVVTVRPRYPLGEASSVDPKGLRWVELTLDPAPAPPRRISRTRTRPAEFGDLDRASWIVCVGTGIGGPEPIRALARAIRPLGGAIAATRRVVDAGWAPADLQVGLTGRTPAPPLAVLVGVSGAPNQMIGWRRAGTVVAINPEPTAPVFRGVDIGLIARHEEALPALLRSFGAASA